MRFEITMPLELVKVTWQYRQELGRNHSARVMVEDKAPEEKG